MMSHNAREPCVCLIESSMSLDLAPLTKWVRGRGPSTRKTTRQKGHELLNYFASMS